MEQYTLYSLIDQIISWSSSPTLLTLLLFSFLGILLSNTLLHTSSGEKTTSLKDTHASIEVSEGSEDEILSKYDDISDQIPVFGLTPPPPPCKPRVHATLCHDHDTGLIVLCGGQSHTQQTVNDVNIQIYLPQGDHWITSPPPPSSISSRATFRGPADEEKIDACYLLHHQSLFSYGGYAHFQKKSLEKYDFVSQKWVSISNSEGPSPCWRYKTSLVPYREDTYILYGGLTEDNRVLGDVWMLYLPSDVHGRVNWMFLGDYAKPAQVHGHWHGQHGTGQGHASYDHSAVIIDDSMYILGGLPFHKDCRKCLHSFHLITRKWNVELIQLPLPSPHPLKPSTSHQPQHQRQQQVDQGHSFWTSTQLSCHLVKSNLLLILASSASAQDEEAEDKMLCDVCLLEKSPSGWRWKPVDLSYEGPDKSLVPSYRTHFASVYDADASMLYIHGGISSSSASSSMVLEDFYQLDVSNLLSTSTTPTQAEASIG